jgi:hypothetical protein
MPDNKKQTVIMTCAIVACIVTLITCGTLIGGAKADISHLSEGMAEISNGQKEVIGRVSTIETDQAFQKGVVQTQLTTQGLAIVRIEKKLDDLVRVD